MLNNAVVQLSQPPLLDFSTLHESDDVKIVIINTKHKFATDAEYSGTDIMKQPIFGSRVYINGKSFSKQSYGLPFIRFPKGSTPKITYENRTQFTFNIHYHGLNTVGSVDGTSMETVFGHSTLLGPKVTFQFPEITNNQSLLWYHSHNMFVSMELIYGGIIGLLQIIDKHTEWLTESFQYGDNLLLLNAIDMDLTSDGKQTSVNLTTDENRSSFTVINGISTVNWYSCQKHTEFVNPLFHITTKNLVKIDILNASLNWRTFHIGVCDKDMQIKSFYLVQTDSGLMNPTELKMTFVAVASRVGIIIDLNQFKKHIAYVFFYNYDLTEILGSTLTFPDQPNNPSLTGIIPDSEQSKNPTPNPTPIPGPDTNLNYPIVNMIPQTEQVLDNGTSKVPRKSTIKPFLKIIMEGECDKGCGKERKHNQLSLTKTISRIRRTIFGNETYEKYKCLIKEPCFEYNPKINYLSFLNCNYYYNLPNFKNNIKFPTRNLFLFSESDTNAISGGNAIGTTEYINGANRIMVDLWNSDELDLEWALQQYTVSPNNYKPPTLPTSKFRIYKTNDKFSNTAMISNDTLKIQIFDNEITYGDFSEIPLATVTIIFPPTSSCHPLNLQEWINLVNAIFQKTIITIPNPVTISTILKCEWSFFPYALDFMYQRRVYVKSAIIKTVNSSRFWVRLLGRWPLLQFFGKPLTGNPLMGNISSKAKNITKRSKVPINNCLSPKKTSALYTKCDEVGIYGIFDAEIQQIFPAYATSDGDVQLPIACMKRDAELIIAPQNIYIGLYDGYLNDNLNSFSVKLRSTETWIYVNGDTTDAHPLHFHLTSGYASPQSTYNSSGLLNCKRLYNPLIYSRDIYQIGPQESIAFDITWPYYSSNEKTKSPNIRCVGGVIHCHFLVHNDANSMIIQYFIDPPSYEGDTLICKNDENYENKKEHKTEQKFCPQSNCCRS
jgi:FtsP/CotA-like multicopper oxidase with cupredoxin domain